MDILELKFELNQGNYCKSWNVDLTEHSALCMSEYKVIQPDESLTIKANLTEYFFEPYYCSGSSGSGDSVTIANYQSIIEYGEKNPEANEFIINLYGGYDSYGIGIRMDCNDIPLWEMIIGLEDYPIIDEEKLSLVEIEAEMEAWDNWIRYDFVSKLESQCDVDLMNVSADDICELYRSACEESNEYGHCEIGGSWTIDLENVIVNQEQVESLPGVELNWYLIQCA